MEDSRPRHTPERKREEMEVLYYLTIRNTRTNDIYDFSVTEKCDDGHKVTVEDIKTVEKAVKEKMKRLYVDPHVATVTNIVYL